MGMQLLFSFGPKAQPVCFTLAFVGATFVAVSSEAQVRLPKAHTVLVQDVSGASVPGAEIIFKRANRPMIIVITDKNGHAILPGREGNDGDLHVSSPGFFAADQTLSRREKTVVVTLQVAGACSGLCGEVTHVGPPTPELLSVQIADKVHYKELPPQLMVERTLRYVPTQPE